MPEITASVDALTLSTAAATVTSTRKARVHQIYLEAPDATRTGQVYQIYLEAPEQVRTGRVHQIYLAAPDFGRSGRVHQIYFAVPDIPSGTGGGIPAGDGTASGTSEEVVVAFDRTILTPSRVSAFEVARGKQSWGQTGKGQFRAGVAAMFTWEETYPPFREDDADGLAFLAYINDLASNERVFDIEYPKRKSTIGTVTGTPVVSGASQIGFSIVSSGWSGSLKRGDLIRITGLNYPMEVVEDVTGPGVSAGTSTIKVNPGILKGGSPADQAEILIPPNLTFRAKIDDISSVPEDTPDRYFFGLRVRFRAAP